MRARSITTRVMSGSCRLTATRTRCTSPWFTAVVAGTEPIATPSKSSSTRAGRSALLPLCDATSRPLPDSAIAVPSGSAIGRTRGEARRERGRRVLARLTCRPDCAATGSDGAGSAVPQPGRRTRRPACGWRSTSTKIRLRDERTRCRAGRSSATRTRGHGAPSGAVAGSSCTPDTGGCIAPTDPPAKPLGPRIPQIDEHGERVGLAGQVRHRLARFNQHGAERRRRGGPEWRARPGRQSAAARWPRGSRQEPSPGTAHIESRVATAHHLFSPPRRNLRTSRCFSSDNGSLTCCRMIDGLCVIASDGPVRQAIARSDRVHLAAGPETIATQAPWLWMIPRTESSSVPMPGDAFRTDVDWLDAALLAGLADQRDERVAAALRPRRRSWRAASALPVPAAFAGPPAAARRGRGLGGWRLAPVTNAVLAPSDQGERRESNMLACSFGLLRRRGFLGRRSFLGRRGGRCRRL